MNPFHHFFKTFNKSKNNTEVLFGKQLADVFWLKLNAPQKIKKNQLKSWALLHAQKNLLWNSLNTERSIIECNRFYNKIWLGFCLKNNSTNQDSSFYFSPQENNDQNQLFFLEFEQEIILFINTNDSAWTVKQKNLADAISYVNELQKTATDNNWAFFANKAILIDQIKAQKDWIIELKTPKTTNKKITKTTQKTTIDFNNIISKYSISIGTIALGISALLASNAYQKNNYIKTMQKDQETWLKQVLPNLGFIIDLEKQLDQAQQKSLIINTNKKLTKLDDLMKNISTIELSSAGWDVNGFTVQAKESHTLALKEKIDELQKKDASLKVTILPNNNK